MNCVHNIIILTRGVLYQSFTLKRYIQNVIKQGNFPLRRKPVFIHLFKPVNSKEHRPNPIVQITKSDFEARPVYLSRHERIKAHFLICFVALVIARILQRRIGGKYSIGSIAGSLSKASCIRLEENWYVFDYSDGIITALNDALGIDLTRKYLQLGDIKKLLAATKKDAN